MDHQAKTRLPAELIEPSRKHDVRTASSRKHGVRTASVPFDSLISKPILSLIFSVSRIGSLSGLHPGYRPSIQNLMVSLTATWKCKG